MKKDEQYYILDNKFSEWFEEPGQGYIPTPEAEARSLKHRRHSSRRRRVYYLINNIVEAFLFGIYGALISAVVVFFISELFRVAGRNSSNTTGYIIFAVVIGFFVGMSIGLASRKSR